MNDNTAVMSALWLALADAERTALPAAAAHLRPADEVRAGLLVGLRAAWSRPAPEAAGLQRAAALRWRQRALSAELLRHAEALQAEHRAALAQLIDALQPLLDLIGLLGPPGGEALRAQVAARRRSLVRVAGAVQGAEQGPASTEARTEISTEINTETNAEISALLQVLGLPALLAAVEAEGAGERAALSAIPEPAAFAEGLAALRRRALGEALRPLEDHLLSVHFDVHRPTGRGAA